MTKKKKSTNMVLREINVMVKIKMETLKAHYMKIVK